jgi:hypothetical protein
VGLLVFTLLCILINKRPLGDLLLMIFGALVIVVLIGYYLVRPAVLRKREQDRQAEEAFEALERREAEHRAPWEDYSRSDGNDWVVGIERRVPGDPEPLQDREMYRFEGGPPKDITRQLDAEGDAITQAARFNSARSG